MNRYKIHNLIVEAPNLLTALNNMEFTNVNIIPHWRGRSNGLYYVTTSECTIFKVEWVDKTEKIKQQLL